MEISFTERELDVMGVLWEEGSATVAEVRERLADDLAYTTVLTVLRTLEEKGYAGRVDTLLAVTPGVPSPGPSGLSRNRKADTR